MRDVWFNRAGGHTNKRQHLNRDCPVALLSIAGDYLFRLEIDHTRKGLPAMWRKDDFNSNAKRPAAMADVSPAKCAAADSVTIRELSAESFNF